MIQERLKCLISSYMHFLILIQNLPAFGYETAYFVKFKWCIGS